MVVAASPTTASCCCAARPCSPATSTGPTRPPRRSTTTAGSTPATSPPRDADGFLTITGRRSESIRSGGEWVAPVEVEAAVLTHPAVAEVGVVGLPDPRWGEVVCAAIVVAARRDAADGRGAARARRVDARRRQAAAGGGRRSTPLPRTDATGQIRRGACAPRSSPAARMRPTSANVSGVDRRDRRAAGRAVAQRSPGGARRTRSCSGCSRSRRRMRAARAWPCAAARSDCTPPTSTTR